MMVSRIKQDISSCDLQPAALLQSCCQAVLPFCSSMAIRKQDSRLCYRCGSSGKRHTCWHGASSRVSKAKEQALQS